MPGRGNGLDAESYKPLTDLDPDYADDMLDTLRAAGVAAYVTPLADGPDLLRLWVDAAATSRARGLLRGRREAWEAAEAPEANGEARETEEAPEREGAGAKAATTADGDAAGSPPGTAAGTTAPDEDELWAQIVAGFDTEVADPVPRWPVAEDIEPGSGPATAGGRKGGNVTRPGDGSFRVGIAPGPRDWSPADGPPDAGSGASDEPDELDEDPDDHFVPPPPPPLPKTDAATKMAWVALLGGPLFLLGAVLLGRPIGEWTTFAAIAACGGGFIALVSRLRRDTDEDDTDDGAVV